MKIKFASLALTTSLIFLFSQNLFAQEKLTAVEIMKKSFVAQKVKDSVADLNFRLINSSGQERIRDTKGLTKLIAGTTDNMRVVTFNSPADVKGTKTLLIEHTGKDDDIWIYLPTLKKVRRLISNNKKDSYVGTDFSYGDFIGQKVEEWTHQLIKEEKVDDKNCYVIESIPKNKDVAETSGYSKTISWIDKESFVTVKGEMFDSNKHLLKRISAKKITPIDKKNNKWQAMLLEAENLQTKHKTIIEFKNFKANVGVSSEAFTTRYLEQ